MSNRVHYTHCPVCNSGQVQPLFTARDHSVSGEEFVVWQCSSCTLQFTQDVPDAAAIGPYYKSPDYISHTNTKKGIINNAYQLVRSFTLKQKAKTIQQYTGLEQGKLLDIGAGTGAFLLQMKKEGWETTGVEPDEDARKVAFRDYKLILQEPSLIQNLPSYSFDAITMWHVLEHVHHLQEHIALLSGLLKPGGKLFIAVPNYQSVDANIYKSTWAAYDVPRHLYHFSPKAMETLMQRHGLKVAVKKPMWFDAFYISLLSSKYRHGQTKWIGAFLSGVRSNVTALGNQNRCSSITYIIQKA